MTRIHSVVVEVTSPAWEPVTLNEAKGHLHVNQVIDDAILSEQIVAARRHAEVVTWRALARRDFDLFLDRFPPVIRMPKPPLVSVASIKYLDTAGVQQTLAATEYQVGKGEPARIRPAWGKTWPSIRYDLNAVEIRFTAGYAAPALVPGDIRTWILRHIGDLYALRENTVIGAPVAQISRDTDAPLWPHRVFYTS